MRLRSEAIPVLNLTGNLIPSRKGRVPWLISFLFAGCACWICHSCTADSSVPARELKVSLLKNLWVLWILILFPKRYLKWHSSKEGVLLVCPQLETSQTDQRARSRACGISWGLWGTAQNCLLRVVSGPSRAYSHKIWDKKPSHLLRSFHSVVQSTTNNERWQRNK